MSIVISAAHARHAVFSAITIGIFQGLKGIRNNASVIMIASQDRASVRDDALSSSLPSQLLNPLVYGLTLLATLNSHRRWMGARDGKTFSMASVGRSKNSFRMKVNLGPEAEKEADRHSVKSRRRSRGWNSHYDRDVHDQREFKTSVSLPSAHSGASQHVIPPEPRRFTNRLDEKTDEIELDQQKSQHSDGEAQKSESETTVTGSAKM